MIVDEQHIPQFSLTDRPVVWIDLEMSGLDL